MSTTTATTETDAGSAGQDTGAPSEAVPGEGAASPVEPQIPDEIAALDYASAFEQLDRIRVELESGDLDVDSVAAHVARARLLYLHCRRKVSAEKLAVRQILATS